MAKTKRTKKTQPAPGLGRNPPRAAVAVRPVNSGTPPPANPGPQTLEQDTAFTEADENAIRYIHAGGPPTQEQLTHAQGSALFVEGEMMNLVWVNQEDLKNLGVRFDIPEHCPECGRPNEVAGS